MEQEFWQGPLRGEIGLERRGVLVERLNSLKHGKYTFERLKFIESLKSIH